VWGVNFVVIDVGLETFPPLLFAALRFALIALPGLLIVGRPDVRARDVILVGTFLSAGQFGLLFVAMDQGMPAGLASIVVQLQVLFTTVLAVAFLNERLTPMQVAGGVVALAGMTVIGVGRTEGIPLIALGLTICSAASWGVGNVLTRKAQARDTAALLVWSSLVPPIPLATLSLVFEGPGAAGDALTGLSVEGVLALLYVVIGATAFGFGAWTWLLRRHPASRVVPFALLVPPAGVVSAWLALGETPNAAELVGAVIVVIGLALTMRALRPLPAPAVEAEATVSP
jgi:O-acetylserine/cysteine efflux transporter